MPKAAGEGGAHGGPHPRLRRSAFAGPDPAVFYPDDDRFLVERGELVDHFDVVFASGDEVTRTVDECGTGIGSE